MYSYDNINKVENSSHQKNIFIKDENNLFNKKITEDTKKKIIANNISLEKQIIKERTKEEERAKKKLLGSNEKKKKAVNKKEGVKNKKRVIKVRGDEGFLKPTEKARKSSVMSDNENMRVKYDKKINLLTLQNNEATLRVKKLINTCIQLKDNLMTLQRKTGMNMGTSGIFGQVNNSMFLPNTGLNIANMSQYHYNTGLRPKKESDKFLNNDEDLDLTY